MSIASYYTTFFLATFLLLCTGTLAIPTYTTGETTGSMKAPEIAMMPLSPYLTQLLESIPILPSPENATALAASRKIIDEAIAAFNLNNPHLLKQEEKEVNSTGHTICETTGSSPWFSDAISAVIQLSHRDGRCKMNSRCTEFASWGEAAIGACTRGFQLWDFPCYNVWRWSAGVTHGCVSRINGGLRTGGRILVDDGSSTDIRVYRN